MTTTATESTAVTYEKGTWQADLDRSVKMADKGKEFKEKAGVLLWKGATTAIEHWVDEADNDEQAEGLASDLLAVMGNSRKGDVSKIKTVALAVRNKGLRLEDHKNLSRAYTAARALTVVAEENAAEDDVLSGVMENVAEQAKSLSSNGITIDQAAVILFSKGEDEAFRAIGDMLGTDDARRAALRAFAADVSGRVKAVQAQEKAKADEEKAAKKAEADKAKAEKAQAKAKAQEEKAKAATPTKATAKPAKAKATPAKAKATPTKATAKPAKATPKAVPAKA